MPVEPSDNTRVNLPPRPQPVMMSKEQTEQIRRQRMQQASAQNQAQLWDADKVKRYQNMQNFYNNNFWGYGTFGRQTNYDPRTPQGQAAIQSNFNYAKSNVENFATTLATTGATEGVVQAVKWATTPVKIGQGAEAVVSSAPLSTQVIKVTTIPRAEMHARNMVPGALRSRYVKTSNGLTTYTQPKVHILSKEQFARAGKALERMMQGTKWKKLTHPNMQGVGFTDGNWVISDIGPGNVGRDWLGRLRLVDFSMEPMPAFRMAMQKRGGKIINNN